jgi:hypothetical protein
MRFLLARHGESRECSIASVRRNLVVLLALFLWPSSAAAAPALVLGRHGGARIHNDPFLSGPAVTPAPAGGAGSGATIVLRQGARSSDAGRFRSQWRRARAASNGKGKAKKAAPITVTGELARIYRSGSIGQGPFRTYNGIWNAALQAQTRLRGTRRAELEAVTSTVHQIAAAHQLNASRLPVLFATVDRNRQWWTSGPIPSTYQRVEFAGSQLVWEYYPGQGIQLQVLGTFGKANALYQAGKPAYARLQQLLSQMIPMAARRGGGLTWEYYFTFDGGAPPWTSAMSQATGLAALTHAYQATHNRYYLQMAAAAMPIFSVPPPVGVNVRTPQGIRFLQYTFTPRTSIINAFLQTLIGLRVYATVSGNQTAAQLFAAGNAEALYELPSFDTGAWSLYQPGVEDDLSYHELVTGFLQQLCRSTGAPLYCATRSRFQAYLTTNPSLTQLTFRGRPRRSTRLRFRLSKVSRVGIVVRQSSTTKLATSASFPYGVHSFSVPALRAGDYSVTLTATDLAGNFSRITGVLNITGS